MAGRGLKRKLDDFLDGSKHGSDRPISMPCGIHNLDLLSLAPTQVIIDDFIDEQLQAFGTGFPVDVSDSAVIEFQLQPSPRLLTSLFFSQVAVTLQVLNAADNSVITDSTALPIIPQNFLGQTIWKNIEVFMNGVKISNQNGFFQYETYIQNLLYTTEDYKSIVLKNQLFIADTAGGFNDTEAVANKGASKRSAYCKDSRKFTLAGRISVDVMMSPRVFSGALQFTFRFYPNSANFCFMSKRANDSLRLRILDMRMFIRRYRVSNDVLEALNNQLMSGVGHLYPITQFRTRSYVLNADEKAFTRTLFIENSPRRLFFFFVSQTARIGSLSANGLEFRLFDLSEVILTIGNVQRPSYVIKLDPATDPDGHLLHSQLMQTLNFECLSTIDSYAFLNG